MAVAEAFVDGPFGRKSGATATLAMHTVLLVHVLRIVP